MPTHNQPGHRVDYDSIAHLYDEPSRDHRVDPRLLDYLDSISKTTKSKVRVLDVGCGTGKQLNANRTAFPAMFMVGLDRFRGMLEIARKRNSSVMWIHGEGSELPFSAESFHYACNQFSYQHARNNEKLLTEIFRVLKPGGRFVMTNIDPWSMTGWKIYKYFPESLELDYQDFLPADRFVEIMDHVGFQDVHVNYNQIEDRESLKSFLKYSSERHRTSQLMAISDEGYHGGIQKLKGEVLYTGEKEKVLESEFVKVTISGDKIANSG